MDCIPPEQACIQADNCNDLLCLTAPEMHYYCPVPRNFPFRYKSTLTVRQMEDLAISDDLLIISLFALYIR